MQWAVGITTAPRKSPTLSRCLESVKLAGWPDYRIFAEPDSPISEADSSAAVTWREGRLGPWPNWFLALSELFQRSPHADAFLLIQDDAMFLPQCTTMPGTTPVEPARCGCRFTLLPHRLCSTSSRAPSCPGGLETHRCRCPYLQCGFGRKLADIRARGHTSA